MLYAVTFFLLTPMHVCLAQSTEHPAIFETILRHYYKNEKPIYKGRNQLLFVYCEKVNNNEEIHQTINELKLPPTIASNLKKQVVTNISPDRWDKELEYIASLPDNVKIKVNACLSLEEYQQRQQKSQVNNQRLMIISKPLFYSDKKTALVKVVFYRSIEHNNGSVLRMEKEGDKWVIKEFLNSWST